MKIALTQDQADELVRQLGLDGEVDDYEFVGDKHTYFLEAPHVLQIDLAGRARIINVETNEDIGRVVTASNRAEGVSKQVYIVDTNLIVVDLAYLPV